MCGEIAADPNVPHFLQLTVTSASTPGQVMAEVSGSCSQTKGPGTVAHQRHSEV